MTTKAEQEAASRWLTQNSKRGSVTLGTKPSVDFYGRFLGGIYPLANTPMMFRWL